MHKNAIYRYQPYLQENARKLRNEMTEAENLIWRNIRRKQILDIQFYRQKPILNYIVDFYAPKIKLVIELDGSQHYDNDEHIKKDKLRDSQLRKLGIEVVRFDNNAVFNETDAILEKIFWVASDRLQMLSL